MSRSKKHLISSSSSRVQTHVTPVAIQMHNSPQKQNDRYPLRIDMLSALLELKFHLECITSCLVAPNKDQAMSFGKDGLDLDTLLLPRFEQK
jgi:hypothetical protein